MAQYLPVKHLQKYPQHMYANTVTTNLQLKGTHCSEVGAACLTRLGKEARGLLCSSLREAMTTFDFSFVGSVGANMTPNQCRAVLHIEITVFRYTTRVYGSCLHNGGPPQWP